MRLHQVGDDRRWVEATERGVGVGGVMLLQHQGVFAFRRFKVSDLVHTFGEFIGILSIKKVRKDTRSQNISLTQYSAQIVFDMHASQKKNSIIQCIEISYFLVLI